MRSGEERGPGLWRAFCSVEYWALVAAGLAGLALAPPLLSIVASALVLSLVSWPQARWRDLVDKARQVDAAWRENARLA